MTDPKKTILGLDRNKVELAEYQLGWAQLYREEEVFLKSLLGDDALAIDHFGSTAIPGIKAKPVIDIMIQTESGELSAAALKKFKDNHYQEKRFDHRVEPMYAKMIGDNIATHNIHVTKTGSEFARVMLGFRDSLRADAILAKKYEELKTDMALRFPDDRQAYYKAKVAFFEKVAGKYN